MKSPKLILSKDLQLDANQAATQTFAFIGRKGSGKTYAAGKLAEEFDKAKVQFVILDNLGSWYGLRIPSSINSKGLDIPIFGGLRGDLPLEPTGGALTAEVIVETGQSMIIDISQFNKADRQRFATDFAQRLWKLKKMETHPTPLHIFIEESQLIIPEMNRGDSSAMVDIFIEIVRLGRAYGIGISLISQRPQSVNKEALNQVECLFTFQLSAAHERKAISEWIRHHGIEKDVLNDLHSLQPGTCYIWSPQWLNVLKKIKIDPMHTFDSSSTPTLDRKATRRTLKPIDMEKIKGLMQETIAKTLRDDPKQLQKEIRELREKLSVALHQMEHNSINANHQKEIDQLRKESASWKIKFDSLHDRHGRLLLKMKNFGDQLVETVAKEKDQQLIDGMLQGSTPKHTVSDFKTQRPPLPSTLKQTSTQPVIAKTLVENGFLISPKYPKLIEQSEYAHSQQHLGKCEQAIINVLAQREQVSTSRHQLAFLAGYSASSGSYKNSLSKLRTSGYISREEPTSITTIGKQQATFLTPLPKGEQLVQLWMGKLGKAEKLILEKMIQNYPGTLSKEEIAERTSYAPTSGSFKNSISKLRTLELILGSKDMKAADVFFMD